MIIVAESTPQTNMKVMSRISTLIVLSLLILAGCNGEKEPAERSEAPSRTLEYTATVEFLNSAGDAVSEVDVAVADDDQSRSEGLMNVHEMPNDAGMLFIFDDEAERSFWMANTPLSLDIIYVNSDYEIVRIHRNTPAYSNDNFLSEEPAMYVVEVNAGYTRSHDIVEGMSIRINL